MTSEIVPVANLALQYRAHEKAIQNAVNRVLESGWYILGKEVATFEEEFSAYIGASHAIGVGSGTDAVALALRACGVQAGDEVITVSHTAVATIAAIEQIGALPVFADIAPQSRCMDPKSIPALISAKTKALVPVHIYGQPAAMHEIMEIARQYGLKVIEDCAQAHGAMIAGQQVGTFGDAAAFSFYPTKNLGACGDGGAVTSNDDTVANHCRWLRQYGWKERYISVLPGINSRLDEMQAAILREKLHALTHGNTRRQLIANRYTEALKESTVIAPPTLPDTRSVFHLYVVECEHRESFETHMARHGIATARHYPQPVHSQPAYVGRIRGSENLPLTERLYERIVSLPMYPELTDDQVARVSIALKSFK